MTTVTVIRVNPIQEPQGAVRGYADVRVTTENGSLRINGIAIVESNKGGYFISLPQRKDTKQDRYFSIVEAEGKLKDEIRNAIMEAYKNG